MCSTTKASCLIKSLLTAQSLVVSWNSKFFFWLQFIRWRFSNLTFSFSLLFSLNAAQRTKNLFYSNLLFALKSFSRSRPWNFETFSLRHFHPAMISVNMICLLLCSHWLVASEKIHLSIGIAGGNLLLLITRPGTLNITRPRSLSHPSRSIRLNVFDLL